MAFGPRPLVRKMLTAGLPRCLVLLLAMLAYMKNIDPRLHIIFVSGQSECFVAFLFLPSPGTMYSGYWRLWNLCWSWKCHICSQGQPTCLRYHVVTAGLFVFASVINASGFVWSVMCLCFYSRGFVPHLYRYKYVRSAYLQLIYIRLKGCVSWNFKLSLCVLL